MSGHSKWHSIKHKKGIADAKRGKIFTRHANLITIAARSGGEPEMNPGLRLAIDNAKKENVPNANIERAIKRGTGELKDAAEILEVVYEGYGPVGVAIMVECLTDNKNRSFTNIRTAFGKNGGSLGESGSVAYMFERKGVIAINASGEQKDDIELAAIDAGADDIDYENGLINVYTKASDLTKIAERLSSYNIESAEIQLIPGNSIEITDENTARKILQLMDALDDDPDVSNVSANFDISEELMQQL